MEVQLFLVMVKKVIKSKKSYAVLKLSVICIRDRPTYRPGRYIGPIFGFHRYIGIGLTCWQNAVIFYTHPDNLRKKAQRINSRELSCSNASKCVFKNKQTRWTM